VVKVVVKNRKEQSLHAAINKKNSAPFPKRISERCQGNIWRGPSFLKRPLAIRAVNDAEQYQQLQNAANRCVKPVCSDAYCVEHACKRQQRHDLRCNSRPKHLAFPSTLIHSLFLTFYFERPVLDASILCRARQACAC